MTIQKDLSIACITSRENFSWMSMQEIIPNIEKCLIELSESHNWIQVELINCDEYDFKSIVKKLVHVDYLYFTCFNQRIGNLMRFLRCDLSSDIPFVIQLHGLASIACWPLIAYGPKSLFYNQDIFIGTCDGDQRALKLSFPEAQFYKIPYPCFINKNRIDKKVKFKEIRDLVYIGRISEQKNIIDLIQLYFYLRENIDGQFRLHFFGWEDNLGFPNMGIKGGGYLKKILKLVGNHSYGQDIIFHGQVERVEIDDFLNAQPHLFISLSTHSDENFGMAARRSLMIGGVALLSSWGGHLEHKQSFPQQTEYVNVELNEDGPKVDLEDAKIKLVNLLKSDKVVICKNKSASSSFDYLNFFSDILNFKKMNREVVKPSDYVLKIVDKWKKYHPSEKKTSKIFSCKKDPLAQPLYRAYLSEDLRDD